MEYGQGHGAVGRYGGLDDPYGSADFSQIVIVPVPFDKTSTYQKGSSKGPGALIEASRNLELYDIETDSQVYLRGIHTDEFIRSETSEEMLRLAYNRIKEWKEKEKFVVLLGGEHSISYSTIKVHAEKYNNLTVLQLDAHTDMQPAYEGNPWSHASVMARVKEIPQVLKIVSVGIRSMSHEELPYLDRSQIFFAHELVGNWIEEVIQKLQNPVYITIDLDVLDPSIMPSTGTPEPGGLTWYQTVRLLKRVTEEREVVGFGVLELCPNSTDITPDFLAAKLIYKLLSYKFEGKK